MLRRTTLALIASLGFLGAFALPAQAQAAHYHVEYRFFNWQERTFYNHAQAHRFEDSMRSRGFEVRPVEHHGSHYHVSWRLPNWTNYRTVDCHEQAHELEAWLRSRGYEARVEHH
jgi:hypothetical protein